MLIAAGLFIFGLNCSRFSLAKITNTFLPLLLSLLQQYWHYPAFRPLQEEIITSVMDGKDTFVLLPTGGGKSVCYQVPALAREGFAIVVSPLIALMQDQVVQLNNRGIPAAFIHSGMNGRQIRATLERAVNNEYKLLYVSPERLQTESFREYAAAFQVNLIAVDEAHCISQWGHDFRPAYLKVDILRSLFPNIPVLALTASANEQVQQDIIQQLKLKQPVIFKQSVVRQNLFYTIRYTENKPVDTARVFEAIKGSGILYCRSRKRCVETAIQLKGEGLDTSVYHAGMNREERERAQQQWTASHAQVMSATTAFGMGIDKPDVRIVAHYDAPEHIEAYYQEAGRAGRDGQKAHAVLFFNQRDIIRLQESTEISYPPDAFIRKVYQLVGDYLQVPVGNGYEEMMAFDALQFVQNFKLDVMRAFSAIRLLEREGFWQWEEQANSQTLIQFTTSRDTLDHLTRSEPKLSYVTTALLRLYGSIYHFPTAIREFDVSRLLKIDKPALDQALQKLAALGIIDYRPGIAGGALYWLHNRMTPHQLALNSARINRLRKAHEERTLQMIRYIQTDDVCRNILLSQYFGEERGQECGGCDACKRNAKKEKAPSDPLKEKLLQAIRQKQQVSISELTAAFPETDSSRIIDYIRLLSDEHLCRVYPTGLYLQADNGCRSILL